MPLKEEQKIITDDWENIDINTENNKEYLAQADKFLKRTHSKILQLDKEKQQFEIKIQNANIKNSFFVRLKVPYWEIKIKKLEQKKIKLCQHFERVFDEEIENEPVIDMMTQKLIQEKTKEDKAFVKEANTLSTKSMTQKTVPQSKLVH